MKLGLDLSYATTPAGLRESVDLAVAAESLGYDSVWAAEAYGSDAVSVLAAVAARTQRIEIGSAVLQIPARSPAMTAMTAASLDGLSDGRFRLGLGVSGPQVSEGWHGTRFAQPLQRTREYVAIVRDALARKRVAAPGPHFVLPLPGGQGKSLALAFDPVRRRLPVYLAAVGPRNLDLCAEIADGWLGFFIDPGESGPGARVPALLEGLTRHDRVREEFDLAVVVGAAVHDDLEVAADRARPHAARYIGGMGSRETNFYHRIASDLGYQREADLVQERFLSRDYEGAAKAVPTEFLQRVSLIGSEAEIAGRLAAYRAAGVDTVIVLPFPGPEQSAEDVLRAIHQAAGRA